MAIPSCGKDIWNPDYQDYLVEKHALLTQHKKGTAPAECLNPDKVLGSDDRFNLTKGSY